MNTIQYDAQADSIRIEDIASNDNNRIVLSRIKRNSNIDNGSLYIQNQHEDEEECVEYVPESTHDMGWLGYFISKSDYLGLLSIENFITSGASITEVLEPFLRGVNNNRSIHTLNIKGMHQLGICKIFTMLNSFFKQRNLTHIEVYGCDLGDEESQLLALALVSVNNNSLESIELIRNNIANEGLVNIITALSIHPDLYLLDLDGNGLHKNECIALSTLLQNSCTQLQTLDLSDNGIDDEGIDTLVPTLRNCYQLQTLRIIRNESISSRGWQQLASILEAPNSNLTCLRLVVNGNNLDDEKAAAFVDALKNNRMLKHLFIGDIMSNNIQVSFSKLLCDTTSINSTYQSNHTLSYLGQQAKQNQLGPLLVINERENKKEVAMIKILQHHNDFVMMPFFEWEFKVLPLMINWFQRASTIEMPRGFQLNIGPRKLASIYQFVRGMPLLYVETRLRQELEEIKVAQAQMEERKRGILERLGRNA